MTESSIRGIQKKFGSTTKIKPQGEARYVREGRKNHDGPKGGSRAEGRGGGRGGG